MAFSTMVLLLFLIVFMIDTMPQYRIRADWRRLASLVDLTTASVFAVEWVLRFYAFVHPMRYLINPMVLLDALGIIPGFFMETSLSHGGYGRLKWLRALQVLRVLRLTRLAVYSVELYVTIRTLRKSMVQILIALGVIISLMLTASFLLFYAENDSLDLATLRWMRNNHGVVEVSPFQNVFFAIYWGLVTLTTVGYGDYTAVSPWGQVITCFAMFMGVFTIVFPTSIISNNFAAEWKAFQRAQRLSDDRRLHYRNNQDGIHLAELYNYANMPYEAGEENAAKALDKPPPRRKSPPRTRYPVGESSPHPGAATPVGVHSHIGPVVYAQMIDMTRKLERDLGVPNMEPSEIAPENEAGHSLLIKAARSRLYTEALATLCERMALRLVAHTGLESTDKMAEYLQYRPGAANAASGRPHGGALSVLEFRALQHVLGNLRGVAVTDLQMPTRDAAGSALRGGWATPTCSDDGGGGGGGAHHSRHHGRHGRHRGRRIRRRLHDVTSRLALSRTTTRRTIHEYISSEALSDVVAPPVRVAHSSPEASPRSPL
ncbi:hypothetical protein H4R21_001589 [Coemansia helicoidea]|uniref:Uncharacterized protein n=2 Tax=Coemansia TaxID=4863 RepID=A0ACC1LBH0_9FUNG|nr:hypothetical protein H4R21_001589 [Coemansia helicoidea]